MDPEKEEQQDGSQITTQRDPDAKYAGVVIVEAEACRHKSNNFLQDCLWPCIDAYANIHMYPQSGQNVSHTLHRDSLYSK